MNWEYKLFKKMNAVLLCVLFDFGSKKGYEKKEVLTHPCVLIHLQIITHLQILFSLMG